MDVAIYVEACTELASLLPWPLRIAATREPHLTLLLVAPGAGKERIPVDLAEFPPGGAATEAGGAGQEGGADENGGTAGEAAAIQGGTAAAVAAELRAVLDAEWGVEGWRPWTPPQDDDGTEAVAAAGDGGDAGDAADDVESPARTVSVVLLGGDDPVASLLQEIRSDGPTTLVTVQPRAEGDDAPATERRGRILHGAGCELVMLRPGRGEAQGSGILVPAARGPHARAALRLGQSLTAAGHGDTTALYVEPDVGPDAQSVGERILDRIVSRAMGSDAAGIRQKVVLSDRRHLGITDACKADGPALVLVGTSKLSALGQRLRGTVFQKVARANEELSVAVVRAAVPLQNRALRRLESLFQRVVPQLERDQRVSLVERVQSNSHWDFDFITLMSLATLIAATGLILDSAAVIIGAMLVAPLMTPLLGLGIALVQANPRLTRLSLRSVGLGFLMAFALSAALGLLKPGFDHATPEMIGRDWPELFDLFVAFVAGLAGAYTSSRPSLLAALPGVAIAAALLPPIATAGLSFAVGDWSLCLGALLLFLANVVAIVLASATCLWAVGLRVVTEGSRLTRITAWSTFAMMLVLAVALTFTPPTYVPPLPAREEFVDELERSLGDDFRLRALEVDERVQPTEVVVRVGGSVLPSRELHDALSSMSRAEYGDGTQVRLVARWEMVDSELAGR